MAQGQSGAFIIMNNFHKNDAIYQHITAIERILLVLMQHALVKTSFDDNNNSIPITGIIFLRWTFSGHIVPVLYSEKHQRHNTFLSSQGLLHPSMK